MPWRKLTRLFRRNLVRQNHEIFPDEILIDAHNLPKFDTQQFEGRLEKPISKRTILSLRALFALVAFFFLGKIWVFQIQKGEAYSAQSENNRLRYTSIFSNRGIIYDRKGVELASNSINDEEPDFARRAYAPLSGIAHVVGYLSYPTKDSAGFYYQTKYVGREGAEKMFDETLSGENGVRIVETDALGNIKSQSLTKPPVDGENVYLSIDAGVQNELYKAIQHSSEEYGFKGGAGVIMDIYTGEVIALTSFPEFSSQVMTQGDDVAAIKSYQTDPYNPFLNRVISGLYTPGSVVKPYVALGALTEKLIDPSKKILSTGSISIQNPYDPTQKTTFVDWKAHGWVDMRDALALSSNVYFYTVGGGYGDQKGLGISNIEKYVRMMGLGEKTGINLNGEVGGVIPNPEWKKKVFGNDPWRIGDTYHTAIGQYGFQLTPIEVVRSVAAIANNGTLLQPTILKKEPGEKNENARTVPIRDEDFKVVREGMRQAVFTVTAGALNVPYVGVAAKTGTAQLGVTKQFVNSWVSGFFPYDNPRYAFVIVLEKGAATNQLGATYVMRQLLDWMQLNTPEYLIG